MDISDTIHHLATYLDTQHIIKCRHINKLFNHVCTLESIWHLMLTNDFQYPIAICPIKMSYKKIYQTYLTPYLLSGVSISPHRKVNEVDLYDYDIISRPNIISIGDFIDPLWDKTILIKNMSPNILGFNNIVIVVQTDIKFESNVHIIDQCNLEIHGCSFYHLSSHSMLLLQRHHNLTITEKYYDNKWHYEIPLPFDITSGKKWIPVPNARHISIYIHYNMNCNVTGMHVLFNTIMACTESAYEKIQNICRAPYLDLRTYNIQNRTFPLSARTVKTAHEIHVPGLLIGMYFYFTHQDKIINIEFNYVEIAIHTYKCRHKIKYEHDIIQQPIMFHYYIPFSPCAKTNTYDMTECFRSELGAH